MSSTLTRQQAAQLVKGFGDHQRFCRHLTIRNKEGASVPYKNSPAGRKLNLAIRKQEQALQPVRVCCLKASQVWMTSSACTELFRRVPFFPGRRALVLADSVLHTDLIFEYFRQYVRSYAENPYGADANASIDLPGLVNDTEHWMRWANDSSVRVGTAYNVEIGRSAPYNWALLSEAAFYRDMGTLMTGLMQRIPNSPDSGLIIESTANGMGGDFYDLCQRAMDPRRASGWSFVFFGYHEHPEYRLDPGPNFKLTREELAELQKYNLHIDQIAWRRRQIETACEGKLERFRQEFPGNPQEAFQSSGHTIFDLAAIARMPVIQDPPRGKLEVVEVGLEKRVQFLQSEDGRGELAVYNIPRKGGRYVIGADHAWGRDLGAKSGSSDPDYSSATVMDIDTGEEMAKLKERLEPFPWANRLYWLAKFYNFAFLTPEAQAVGKAVISHLMELQYPLELIYNRQREADDRRSPVLHLLGFDTNMVSRPRLISNLDQALSQGAIKLHDRETIQQLQQFVRKPNGREEGIGHDDDVFGVAFCVEGLPYARRAFEYRESQDKEAQKWKPQRYGQASRDDDDD